MVITGRKFGGAGDSVLLNVDSAGRITADGTNQDVLLRRRPERPLEPIAPSALKLQPAGGFRAPSPPPEPSRYTRNRYTYVVSVPRPTPDPPTTKTNSKRRP